MLRHMVSPHSGVALYRQVANDIRRRIADGSLAVDAELLPEKAMAAEYNVGLDTVREALVLLRSEGLIETRRGYRARVRAPRDREGVWLRPGQTAITRMPVPSEREELDIPEGVPVFIIGDRLYPGDRYELRGERPEK